MQRLLSLVPAPGLSAIRWDLILCSDLAPLLQRMARTQQNPAWHAEGDVWTHTQMVCERLIASADWPQLSRRQQEALFLAGLLHDIGKITCTREENGVLVSPHHASVGDKMARTLLWRDFGLCGTYEAQQLRETICALIRHHSAPYFFLTKADPERSAVQLAAISTLVPGFSNRLLAMLAEADMQGRISPDTPEHLEHVTFFREISLEAGCLESPVPFPSAFSRYAYLSGRGIALGQDLYDDTWGTVILMAGLPGTGKDTYIHTHHPDLPMLSLDALRTEMNISPVEPQGRIIHAAQDRAREYLRKKQPFVFNATNISPSIRQKQMQLFMNYHAAVNIVFLETPWEEMLRRNGSRTAAVPEAAISRMLEKLVMPHVSEAQDVKWVTV